METTLFKVVVS